MQVFRSGDTEISYYGSVAPSLEEAYLRIRRQGTKSLVELKSSSFPKGITDDVILTCMQLLHRITQTGGFLLHASWIRYQGKAILFTGASGIGKSTQAALWRDHRGAELLNGDRAAVFGDHAREIPFRGSSGVGLNRKTPLAAIVYLSQAPETTIVRLTGARAFRRLWEGCSVNIWNPADME
jgi:hypothetical protein